MITIAIKWTFICIKFVWTKTWVLFCQHFMEMEVYKRQSLCVCVRAWYGSETRVRSCLWVCAWLGLSVCLSLSVGGYECVCVGPSQLLDWHRWIRVKGDMGEVIVIQQSPFNCLFIFFLSQVNRIMGGSIFNTALTRQTFMTLLKPSICAKRVAWQPVATIFSSWHGRWGRLGVWEGGRWDRLGLGAIKFHILSLFSYERMIIYVSTEKS